MRSRVLAHLLTTFVAACGSPDGGADAAVDAAAAPARIELGTGTANFEPIGSTMELVAGPQGGWHLFVTCRLYGLDVEDITLTYAIDRDGERISMPLELVLGAARFVREGDHLLRAGDFVVFDITTPSDVVGTTVTVTVTATPAGGEAVTDARTVRVVDDEP